MFDAQNTSAASTTTEAERALGTEGTASASIQATPSKAADKASAKKAAKADNKGTAGASAPVAPAAAPVAPVAADARRPTGIEPDAEMDCIVADAERSWKREADVQLVDLLDANSRGVLTLFPYVPRTYEAGKVYPAMTGHLDTSRVKVRVSAFVRKTEEGREFLSLAIGPQGQDHIGGAVFRSEEQDEGDGLWRMAPGKENERHGVISKTQRIEGTDDYETVFELRFYGRRRLTGAGVPYIKAQVYQERRDAQANGDADAFAKTMEGCF